MKFSMFRRIVNLLLAAMVSLLATTPAWPLEPLSDEALGRTHAATGVRLVFEDLVINYTADETGFIAHENCDSLGRGQGAYGSVGLGNFSVTDVRLDGEVRVQAQAFAFAEQPYFAQDVWKEESGDSALKTQKFEHVSEVYALNTSPQFNDAGRQVMVLETSGDVGAPFLETCGIQGGLQVAYGTANDRYALGTLGVSNLQLIDQRTILYAMPEIAGYCSGEGIAAEMGLRLSNDSVNIGSPSSGHLTFLQMKGIHLRESFADDWGDYDYLGSLIKQSESDIYTRGTGDAGGFQAGDESRLISTALTGAWGGYDPGEPVSVSNMYGGRFMIGNLRQVGFNDHVAGNGDVPFHENHAGQLALLDNGDDKQGDSVSSAEILERPLTLSVKKRPDGSQCVVLNMPLHGSIRVEEVLGYNSPPEGAEGYLGGNSMGPLIVDGLRVKKLYIEFPGRNETYQLTTAVNESFNTPNPHTYEYRAGQLPVAQPIPDGQRDYNPMGRGVEWFLQTLGPDPGPLNSGWDQYRTELDGKAFWQVREPYPINHDLTAYN